MKLKELAAVYRSSAQQLAERIARLKRERQQTEDEAARRALELRIETLTGMYRETRDIAVVCERYYERGYCRNAKYRL